MYISSPEKLKKKSPCNFVGIAKFPQQDWISFQSSQLTNESACFPTGVTILFNSCDVLGEKWYLSVVTICISLLLLNLDIFSCNWELFLYPFGGIISSYLFLIFLVNFWSFTVQFLELKSIYSHLHTYISSVQSLSRVRLFATPWITACQASLSITNSQSLLKLMSIESVMLSIHKGY